VEKIGMLILTGPTASSKNTVGRFVATARERCAVVDCDVVRAMLVQPHRAPWQGDEGKAQQILGARLVSMLAERLALAGWEVIVLDVLTAETAALYRDLLQRFKPVIVQLMPTFDAVQRRSDRRGPLLTDAEFHMVYQAQSAFTEYDARIDNTNLEPAEVAARLADLL
jgi:hypothetical protein